MSTTLFAERPFHPKDQVCHFLQFFGLARGESPPFEVIKRFKSIEIRSYPPLVIAETEAPGNFEFARQENLGRLKDYFNGDNTGGGKIEMTTPTRIESTDTGWKMSLYLPQIFALSTTPRPHNGRIRVHLEPALCLATIRYTGTNSSTRIADYGNKLMQLIRATSEYASLGRPMSAHYDPPYTIPFLRRNEVQIRVTTGN